MRVTYLSISMFVFSRPSHMIGISQSRLHSQRPVHNAARSLCAVAHHTEAGTATQGVITPLHFNLLGHTWAIEHDIPHRHFILIC